MIGSSNIGATGPQRRGPEEHQVDEAAVAEIIQMASVASAAFSLQPIPILDLALMAPVQIGMVQAIGHAHGYSLDRKAALEMISTLGAAIVARSAVYSLTRLIPIAGWLVGVPMAYAMTYSLGEVAHYYFSMGRGVSSASLRDMFSSRFSVHRKAAKQATGKSDLKSRLSGLVEAYEAGLITDEEFEQKKRQILAEI